MWPRGAGKDRCKGQNMTSDDDETEGFRIADEKIGNLLKRLAERGVCPCCAARALAFHAAALAEDAVGSAEASELFETIATELREHDEPAPGSLPSTQTH